MHLGSSTAGWATTIQDAGRRGFADIGVPTSGALDAELRAAAQPARRQPGGAAVLETLGGLRIRPTRRGRRGDERRARAAGGRPPARRSTSSRRQATLWGYLAVRGGIDVEPVLGSRSQDSRSGLGPPPSRRAPRCRSGPIRARRSSSTRRRRGRGPTVVDVWPGPRVDWFVDGALDAARGDDVDRVPGRQPRRRPPRRTADRAARVDDELPSEGLVTGAVQVPADGRPVVMLADHPTTGGYPVLAVVDPTSLAAWSRPARARRCASASYIDGGRYTHLGVRMSDRLRFGIFMAPFHQAGENPTLAIERDLELDRSTSTGSAGTRRGSASTTPPGPRSSPARRSSSPPRPSGPGTSSSAPA